MAKKKLNVNMELLQGILSGTILALAATDDAKALVKAGYIEVNNLNIDAAGNAPVRITDAGKAYVMGNTTVSAVAEATPVFGIIKGIELPPSKRGNRSGGAPKRYPFDNLEVNDSFFVPVSEKQPDPLKSMQSTVSSANHRWSEETSEYKTVERVKRGPKNKAQLDPSGNKIYETVQVKVRKPLRKFSIRGVKKGTVLGQWTVPADGVVIQRVALPA